MADPAVLSFLRGFVGRRYVLFTQGACWAVFEALHARWPAAKAWYDPIEGHVYTEIDGVLYDAYGALGAHPAYFRVLTGGDRRAISQMRRSALRSIRDWQASAVRRGFRGPPDA